ncbi:uncharacterized protein LOC115287456 isoform X2 [Suricata suricatta]|uniref:uncharacterized protein LOC115287456 isoform X2 n=1 Tax=Suricata suricatta TaxID=37032 RepID=UPI001155C27F|nr:uncharacterized protein LOC115287456 isoform X2 [Suricata suricatta]
MQRRDCMLQCLLAGMQAASNKVLNFVKLREVLHGPHENPAIFLNRLTEALTRYTHLDPTSHAGARVLAMHFITQSAPDIRKKLKKAEVGPETPIQDLLKLAFKVFNTQEETAEARRQSRMKQKVALQTQALVGALRLTGPGCRQVGVPIKLTPPGACFKCGNEGHWARQCPNPGTPTRPCPACRQMGQWKSDCPSVRRSPAPPRGGPTDQTIPSLGTPRVGGRLMKPRLGDPPHPRRAQGNAPGSDKTCLFLRKNVATTSTNLGWSKTNINTLTTLKEDLQQRQQHVSVVALHSPNLEWILEVFRVTVNQLLLHLCTRLPTEIPATDEPPHRPSPAGSSQI